MTLPAVHSRRARRRPPRAATLVLAAGLLALMAALALGLFSLVRPQSRAAVLYTDAIRAEMLAAAGLNCALGKLREAALDHPESLDADAWDGPRHGWFRYNYLAGKQEGFSFPDGQAPYSQALGASAGRSSDRFTLQVDDAGSKINLNACDNLAVVLDNLCRLIGPPLVAADQKKLLPLRWRRESDERWPAFGSGVGQVAGPEELFGADRGENLDVYFWLYDRSGQPVWKNGAWQGAPARDQGGGARPLTAEPNGAGVAVFGDGYAIAGYRATHGQFGSLEDVKQALTYVEQNGNGIPDEALEQAEIEAKFAALRPFLTTASWVDANAVCVGKFEWVSGAGVAGAPIADREVPVRASFGAAGCATAACQILIDRDKSWIADDPVNDPLNTRGSLRGCYVAIISGHGSGQLRRIAANGADWIAIRAQERMTVPPGPISSYLIVAPEDAPLVEAFTGSVNGSFPVQLPPAGEIWLPQTDSAGVLVDNLNIDYAARPLCIHRAPVNVNTASDKVLAALFLGLNVQHAHPMSLGTDVNRMHSERMAQVYPSDNWEPRRDARPYNFYLDREGTYREVPYTFHRLGLPAGAPSLWYSLDPSQTEPRLLTPAGLKRTPVDAGLLVLDRPAPGPDERDFGYIHNYGQIADGRFVRVGRQVATEAHELACRIIQARQLDLRQPTLKYLDADGHPTATPTASRRGPFRSWDDLYFRVVKPWDDRRMEQALTRDLNGNRRYDSWHDVNGDGVLDVRDAEECAKTSLARMIMAHFNSNTDILKFNPNIEWIDRYGRNFTELEPVMVYRGCDPAAEDLGLATRFVQTLYWTWFTNWEATKVEPDKLPADARPAWGVEDTPVSNNYDVALEWPDELKFQHLGSLHRLKEHGRLSPGGYIIRNFRYRSDELIDKTDLNRSTTEFCFDSNGIYEIRSTGQVIEPSRGAALAERQQYALVKIYDVWRETTQQQFVQGTISAAANPTALKWSVSGGANPGNCSGKVVRDASPVTDAGGRPLRKALDTLPEPLVPLDYRIANPSGRNREVVDSATGLGAGQKRDAFRRAQPVTEPDVLANGLLPARYDGQLVLATNTSGYDPSQSGDRDTFLASFNGDLDTDTSQGNGREQAKTPADARTRVVDTVGLLGRLNDTEIDVDPGLPDGEGRGGPDNRFPKMEYVNYGADWQGSVRRRWGAHSPFVCINRFLDEFQLNEKAGYWNNVSVRSGDLRPEGVFLGGAGVSGKDATLKYLFDNDEDGDGVESGVLSNLDPCDYGANRVEQARRNFDPGSPEGNVVTMWFKPAWHHHDNRHHEFFNASNPVTPTYYYDWFGPYRYSDTDKDWFARYVGRPCFLVKAGRYWDSELESDLRSAHAVANGVNMGRAKNNDLLMAIGGNCDLFPDAAGNKGLRGWDHDFSPLKWDSFGRELVAALHGGVSYVLAYQAYQSYLASSGRPSRPLEHRESPAFRIQPFRWGVIGMRWRYPDQKKLDQAKPLTPRMKSCQYISSLLPDSVSTFNDRSGFGWRPQEKYLDPQHPERTLVRRMFMPANVRCPLNWATDFRAEDDYYILPGSSLPLQHYLRAGENRGAGLSWDGVKIYWMYGLAGHDSPKGYYSAGRWAGTLFADYLGAWGCWRRPVVAPAEPDQEVNNQIGRLPPACAVPSAHPGLHAEQNRSQLYIRYQWDWCYAVPLLLGLSFGSQPGAELWYSTGEPPGQGIPFVPPDGLPPRTPQPPAFARLKPTRPVETLIGDHYDTLRFRCRPFVDTQRHPEGPEPDQRPHLHYEDYWTLSNHKKLLWDAPCDIGNSGPNGDLIHNLGRTGQDVKYYWADPASPPRNSYSAHKCFSINNFNSALEFSLPSGFPDENDPDANPPRWSPTKTTEVASIYRQTPGADGTFAVIDELKISSKDAVLKWSYRSPRASDPYAPSDPDWSADRVKREMNTSRYYFPADPADRRQCPTFTSQSLLQSLKSAATTQVPEHVTLARVSWNVFTPRFMHEYKEIAEAPRFKRVEYHTRLSETPDTCHYQFPLLIWPQLVTRRFDAPSAKVAYTQSAELVGYRGPFDYDTYNPDPSRRLPERDPNGRLYAHIGVDRPDPDAYLKADVKLGQSAQPHSTRGVEVELLNGDRVVPGSSYDPASGAFRNAEGPQQGTFTDPDVLNRFLDAGGRPAPAACVRTDQLRYRVRFRYPIDPLADPAGGQTVSPQLHILLDTPVFDDIAITYFSKTRILAQREVTE